MAVSRKPVAQWKRESAKLVPDPRCRDHYHGALADLVREVGKPSRTREGNFEADLLFITSDPIARYVALPPRAAGAARALLVAHYGDCGRWHLSLTGFDLIRETGFKGGVQMFFPHVEAAIALEILAAVALDG